MDPNQRKELLIKAMSEGMTYEEYAAFNKQLAKEGKPRVYRRKPT